MESNEQKLDESYKLVQDPQESDLKFTCRLQSQVELLQGRIRDIFIALRYPGAHTVKVETSMDSFIESIFIDIEKLQNNQIKTK